MVELELSLPIGLELVGKMTGSKFEYQAANAGEKHACEECIDICLKFKSELNLTLKFLECKWLSTTTKLMSKEFIIGYFYNSDDLKEFGIGHCPHIIYRVTITTRDSDSNLAGDIPVTLTNGDKVGTTNDSGALAVYYPKGNYIFKAVIDGQTVTASQYVDEPCSVILTSSQEYLDKLEAMKKWAVLADKITDHTALASGTFKSGAKWRLYVGGEMVVSGKGAMDS